MGPSEVEPEPAKAETNEHFVKLKIVTTREPAVRFLRPYGMLVLCEYYFPHTTSDGNAT